ncbi:NfeD family protein [Pollutimonas harenae]|uniref:Nodulation protein NfeD n=1 Tax=Pollutimonas harenae TaxID=657015 RepID=A0A853GV18_9BURK|nr:nodulation protein NfeD [Pollutimonas harenae]NYT85987.1 nodulation protein NfeD [Pollutimonas harenae]TEA71036.1 nodulation protein NfeD [Pollutimonas harenae]
MNRIRAGLFTCILLLGFLAAATQFAAKAEAQALTVTVLQVNGVISPATSDFITRGLKKAVENGSALAVIELDTPGGLDTSMRSIIRQILASPIPVASFVSPSGARAASAGTFILYASHIAAMTPASNLGAASPVSIGMPGAGAENQDKKSDNNEGGKQKSNADTLSSKATNDAAAYIRSLAQLRGRNTDFAEQAVLQARSMSAQEALKAGVIDVLAGNIEQLLAQIDGRTVMLDGGVAVTLHTKQAIIERVEPGWRTQILSLLANPQIALILMMVGIYGLFFELMSPGAALPGVAGLICLLLSMYAFQLLPVNWAGVGLIAAGSAMMIAEAFLPSFGVLGVGGIVAFVLGGLFLTDTGMPGFDLSIPFLIGLSLASAGLIIATGILAARMHKRKVVSGQEDMLGIEGTVTSTHAGMSYAEMRGESWRVSSAEALSPGDRVKVVAMNGLILQVVRTSQAAAVSLAVKGESHVL